MAATKRKLYKPTSEVRADLSHWTIGLLDSFRIEHDGEVVARLLGRRKQDRLLAYLAQTPGKAFSRERVVEALWPDRSLILGRNRLGEVLHYLRSELTGYGMPPGSIVASRYILQIHPAITTDVERFKELFAGSLQAGDPDQRRLLLERALALYGQGLLPTFSESWLEAERSQLAAIYNQAAEDFIDALAQGGREQHVVALAAKISPRAAVEYYLQGRASRPAAAAREGSGSAESRSADDVASVATAPVVPGQWKIGDSIDELERRHALRCLAMAEQAEPHLMGPEQTMWLDQLEREHDNLKAALRWAIERRQADIGTRLAGSLWRFWYDRGRVDEGRQFLEQVLSITPLPMTESTARTLNGAGALALHAGDLEIARSHLRRALAFWQEQGDRVRLSRTLANLGIIAYKTGDYDTARKRYGEAINLIREVARPELLAATLHDAALVEIVTGHHDPAEAILNERLTIGRALRDDSTIADSLANLATIAMFRDDRSRARSLAEEALTLFESTTDLRGISFCLRTLGSVAHHENDLAEAHRLYEDSLSVSRLLGDMRGVGESLRYLAAVSADMGDPEQAGSYYQQALGMLTEVGDADSIAKVQKALADLGTA